MRVSTSMCQAARSARKFVSSSALRARLTKLFIFFEWEGDTQRARHHSLNALLKMRCRMVSVAARDHLTVRASDGSARSTCAVPKYRSVRAFGCSTSVPTKPLPHDLHSARCKRASQPADGPQEPYHTHHITLTHSIARKGALSTDTDAPSPRHILPQVAQRCTGALALARTLKSVHARTRAPMRPPSGPKDVQSAQVPSGPAASSV